MIEKKKKLIRIVIAAFFFGLFLLYWKAPDFIGVGHVSRYNLTQAIVDDHSFIIDRFVANTCDWSKKDGHYYTNKAPGVSFLSVPFYYVISRFGPTQYPPGYKDRVEIRRVDLFVTAIPAVLLAFLLFLFMSNTLNASTSDSLLVTFIYAVCTIAFPYSTMMWGHQTGAFFLFAAFYILTRKKPLICLAGAAASWAVLCDYSALPALIGLLFLFPREKKALVNVIFRFVVGTIPGFLIFCFYHWKSFGGPFVSPFRYGNSAFLESGSTRLLGVLGLPTLEALWGITFSLSRGLFVLSPILLFAAVGVYRWAVKMRTSKMQSGWRIWSAAVWIIGTYFWFNLTFNGWHGGFALGPRYLVPMLPFLSMGLLFVKRYALFWIAVVVSAINVVTATAVDTQYPPGVNVLFGEVLPAAINNANIHHYLLILYGIVGALVAALVLVSRLQPKASAKKQF